MLAKNVTGTVDTRRNMEQFIGLTPPLLNALREVASPSLFKRKIPTDAREKLIELGYVEQRLGGLVATAKGNRYLAIRLARRKRKRIWRPGE